MSPIGTTTPTTQYLSGGRHGQLSVRLSAGRRSTGARGRFSAWFWDCSCRVAVARNTPLHGERP